MIEFLLSLLHGVHISLRTLSALETIEQPALSSAARRYKVAACCFMMLAGVLAIPAAVIHTMIGECQAFNLLGFGALIATGLSIFFVIRFSDTQRSDLGAVKSRIFRDSPPVD